MELDLWKCILLLVFTLNMAGCCRKYKLFFVLYKDERASDHYNVTIFPDKTRCALYCRYHRPCLSFAYDGQTRECYLYDRNLGRSEATTVHPGLLTFVSEQKNIALNKATKQSSVLGNDMSYKGVDGFIAEKSKIQTGRNKPSWWCVDLLSNYDIDHVVIYNRQGGFAYRIRNFKLHVSPYGDCSGEKLDSSSVCYVNDGQTKNIYNITSCNQGYSLDNTRSVYISLYNTNLHFQELEAYSKQT